MDLDQIVKRLEWIDSERRKDKTVIATLEDRLASTESMIPPLVQQIRELSGEVSRLSAQLSRFDQIETNVAQVRVDLSRQIDAVEKGRIDHDREVDKVRLADNENIMKTIAEVRKGQEPIPDLRKGLQARQEEEFRLSRLIEEVEKKVVDTHRYDEEYRRSLRLLDEGRRHTNRLPDLQRLAIGDRHPRGDSDVTLVGHGPVHRLIEECRSYTPVHHAEVALMLACRRELGPDSAVIERPEPQAQTDRIEATAPEAVVADGVLVDRRDGSVPAIAHQAFSHDAAHPTRHPMGARRDPAACRRRAVAPRRT